MPLHEEKACPRCQQSFQCKVGDIANCQCSRLQLTHEERVHIEQKYNDCLCIRCLHELKDKSVLFKEKFFPGTL